MIYAVTAIIDRKERDRHGTLWIRTTQVPTFYLNSDVQGFKDVDGAMQVATDLLNPFRDESVSVHGYATALPDFASMIV